MKSNLLNSVTVAVFLTSGMAYAQTMNEHEKGAPKDTIQTKERSADDMKSHEMKAAPKAVQSEQLKDKAAEDGGSLNNDKKDRSADIQKREEGGSAEKSTSANDQHRSAQKPETTSTGRSASDTDKSMDKRSKASSEQMLRDQKNADSKKSEDTRSNDARADDTKTSAAVSIDPQKQTRIRDALRNQRVENIPHVDFDVRVGSVVPDHYHFYPVPEDVVEIVPQYRGYDYIMADNNIIILEPETHKIVYTLKEGRSAARNSRSVECR